MNYVKALLIKLFICTAVIWFILGLFYSVSFGHVLMLSIIISVASFVLGDLFILPRIDNWAAVIADFVFVVGAVWFYSAYVILVNFSPLSAAGMIALIIAFGELFFHRYVDKHIVHVDKRVADNEDDYIGLEHSELRTEFARDIDPSEDERKE